jgi:hypothetical protein
MSSTPDLEVNEGAETTNWDVSSIVGDTSVAVVVHIRVADDAEGSYAQLRTPGTSGLKTTMASALHQGEYIRIQRACNPL